MKFRSPRRNGLISLIPIYGLSSFFYLGWRHGLSAFFVNLLSGIVIMMLPALSYMSGIEILPMGVTVVAYPLLFVVQYLIVKHYTVERNKEKEK
jgi:hypothetical protein